MARILVVEDERKVLRSLERGLQAEGYDVVAAATGEEGFQQAIAEPFDCVVLDLLLPGPVVVELSPTNLVVGHWP